MGSGKGEEEFNSKEKSKRKFMQFFQVFMTELSKYINGHVDVPAGDLGLGAREISFMDGKHKQLNNEFTGALTGKAIQFWGSLILKEATGYGCAYFNIKIMLNL